MMSALLREARSAERKQIAGDSSLDDFFDELSDEETPISDFASDRGRDRGRGRDRDRDRSSGGFDDVGVGVASSPGRKRPGSFNPTSRQSEFISRTREEVRMRTEGDDSGAGRHRVSLSHLKSSQCYFALCF